MSQRRLDGVRQTSPKKEERKKRCVDCNTRHGLTYYPSADEYACAPCSNGTPEINGDRGERFIMDDFISDKVFPKVKVGEQENQTFKYIPKRNGMPAHSEKVADDWSVPDSALVKRLALGKAYGLSDKKFEALKREVVEATGIPAHMWEFPQC